MGERGKRKTAMGVPSPNGWGESDSGKKQLAVSKARIKGIGKKCLLEGEKREARQKTAPGHDKKI